jgi:hypothetical protein
MRNRPGRIYYMIDFKGLAESFIREYCEDNLENKQHIDKICSIASLFHQFNFDMLKALVEEMNRYGESPQDALRMLNASPEYDNDAKYEVQLIINGKEVEERRMSGDREWRGNPLSPEGISIGYYEDSSADEGDWEWSTVSFTSSHLQKIDSSQSTFVFGDATRKLILKKVQPKYFNYDAV